MSDYKTPITSGSGISKEEMDKVMELVRKWAPIMEATASNSLENFAYLLESEEKFIDNKVDNQ